MEKNIPRYEIDEELLKQLRKEGLTYREISDYLERENGIRVSISTICNRLREISKREGTIEKAEERQKQEQMLEEQLKALREQGFSYKAISEKLTSNGNKITLGLARKKIKQIYSKEKKQEPKAQYKKSPELEKITDEELLKLRKMGFGARKIQLFYNEKGIKVSRQWVWIRVKELEKKQKDASNEGLKENKLPREAHAQLIEYILKLKDTKNANDEQIKKIAKLYGVNLNGTRINKPLLAEDELDFEER